MELYEKIHPEGWKDYPDTATPIEGDNLTHIEEGIYENSVNIKKVNNVTKYITATAGADGDFWIDIENDLVAGMVLNVSFPVATNPASNARLSIDGGTNYYNIKNKYSIQLVGLDITNKAISLYYNGTEFIYKGNDNVGKMIYLTSAGGSTQAIPAQTVTKITNYSNTVLNDFLTNNEISYSSGTFTINSGNISKLLISWQPFFADLADFYTYIFKNGIIFLHVTPPEGLYRALTTFVVPVSKGDTIEISVYIPTAGTIRASENNIVSITVLD